ncbi:hypothetical protein DICPUDRAFT_48687 [Dictyostelium purpureum]|uniref:GH16 domain-containing protein n=1 Tax=Dictyostelium purpureum TaxID=5786 RepID=F0ZQ81_DICPU|nr:uncharacterized protein DICPUDRAFT_48687 [Dictyostelium purpureum]EGC33892.1 hypothetical protein DICPUDRAFT_48687 [Dictyostelium purpureum]|eukprot:XP_003289575.1 hypothetical protein DICPUDRAFT_48687 [Dictyostelium purpureum]
MKKYQSVIIYSILIIFLVFSSYVQIINSEEFIARDSAQGDEVEEPDSDDLPPPPPETYGPNIVPQFAPPKKKTLPPKSTIKPKITLKPIKTLTPKSVTKITTTSKDGSHTPTTTTTTTSKTSGTKPSATSKTTTSLKSDEPTSTASKSTITGKPTPTISKSSSKPTKADESLETEKPKATITSKTPITTGGKSKTTTTMGSTTSKLHSSTPSPTNKTTSKPTNKTTSKPTLASTTSKPSTSTVKTTSKPTLTTSTGKASTTSKLPITKKPVSKGSKGSESSEESEEEFFSSEGKIPIPDISDDEPIDGENSEESDDGDDFLIKESSEVTTSSKLISCSDDVVDDMSTDGNFLSSISSISNNPYSCTLLSENVQYTNAGTKKIMKLTLDNEGCPSKCLNNSYTCAEVESTQKLSYGTYTFNLVPSPATNSITKAYIASGGKGQYSDVFFKINGNSTSITYGYTYFGVLVQFTDSLPGADFTLFHNYTFIYTSTGISWYFDKLLLKNKIESTYFSSGAKIPVPPMNYYVSLTNNQEKSISATKLPTHAQLSLFNYISAPCINGSSESDSELFTQWNTSPIGYFISNCTSYRPIDIYNDTLQGNWLDKSNTMVRDPSTQFARIGTSIGFALNRGNDYFRLRTNETFPVRRHKYLSFWLNGGNSGKQSLVLYLTYNSLRVGIANIGDYLLGGIEAGVWYKVIIPLFQIPINPSNVTKIDGFMIQGTNSEFMDMVYLDDIQFSNGTVCMDLKNETNISYFDKGEFLGGANNTYSSGNINFKSKASLYRGYTTIEFQVSSFNNLMISLENGTLNTNLYDGFVFDLYFEPDPNYQFPGLENTESNEDVLRNVPPKQLNAAICLGEETIQAQLPCMGITQYVGGEFPANRWIELSIPFFDLFAFKNALITSIQFKTNIPEHQGSLYIGRIMAAHFVPPFHEADDDSSFTISNFNFNFNILLILLIIQIILLL